MLNLLECLQQGSISSRCFMMNETSRHILNLELSNNRDVEPVHQNGVTAMDIDRNDNQYLLSGSNAAGIAIHDLMNTSGKTAYTCKVLCKINPETRNSHTASISTVLWYPHDTGIFTSSCMDHKLKVWDTNTLKSVETFSMKGKVYNHSMSTKAACPTLIAAATDYPHVVIADIKSGSACSELRGHKGKVLSVKWSPFCEHLLASGGSDNRILLWDIRSSKSCLKAFDQHNGEAVTNQKDLITAHNGAINSLCFTTDGLYLLSFGTDSHMRLWELPSCKNTLVNYGKIYNISHKTVQIDVCYDSYVPVVFIPCRNHVLIYDMFSGSKLSVLPGHFGNVNCCVFRRYYHELYSGGNDKNIMMWTSDESEKSEDEKSAAGLDEWSSDEG